MWQPTFVNIDDSFTVFVNLEHLLCIDASQNFVTLDVALEGDSPDLLVCQIESLLQDLDN